MTGTIFILGILQRSGTNFLNDLLLLHPDCGAPAPIWENFLVTHADLLVRYANLVYRRWDPAWGVDEYLKDSLCKHLGDGITSFLTSLTDKKRLVTKTPSVRNLSCFFTLFPKAHLIVMIRDGREVVESGVKSFGWDYEASSRWWAEAAADILSFNQVTKGSDFKYLIVRYEELCSNLKGELSRILDFLDLDTKTYDFDAAENLPIRGSSIFRGGRDSIHWEPVKKTSSFTPLFRSNHWSRAMHERFNWIAGKYMMQFGYELKQVENYKLLWVLWNRIWDIKWRSKTLKKSWKSRKTGTSN